MAIWRRKQGGDAQAMMEAIQASQAVIQFTPDGVILDANDNFLKAMGYTLDEIRGRHHRMFVDQDVGASADYARFWDRLAQGQADVAEYRRLGKNGREVWIEASYNPIRDRRGRVVKVVKFAIDVTAKKTRLADLEGQILAIHKSQAVIEFAMDGTILDANANFLKTLGYTLDEVRGKHHRIFVDPAFAASADYQAFWGQLNAGQFQQAQYKRIGKNGREVWIEASYNPILDLNGTPYKVVKFATDITPQISMLGDLKILIDVNFAEIDQALRQSSSMADTAGLSAAEASSNVQMVASASEQLAASIAEIAASMTKSQAAGNNAYDQIVQADDATQRLADAAASMSGIVRLIQDIASQINLLALNATIESARAGEAGRGFAVVANEVKNLATQAAQATDQIGREISGMQAIADRVVGALGQIRGAINTVQEYVAATASAVEEQAAVTHSMSANMQGASTSVTAIAQNVGEIGAAVQQVDQAVIKTRDAATVLAR